MYFFGHLGITLGAAVLGTGAITAARSGKSGAGAPGLRSATRKSVPSALASWVRALDRFLDIRLLLIGSLLPDIIDKPVGYLAFHNGRVFSHTLLFAVVTLAFGIYLYRRYRQTWLLALNIGTLVHLVLDYMWLSPQVIFWPLLGVEFPRFQEANWFTYWLTHLFGDLANFVPELIGGLVMVAFAVYLIREKTLRAFLFKGTLDPDRTRRHQQKAETESAAR
jgi:inner membrane protein